MDRKDGFFALKKVESHDSTSSNGRRRFSQGSNWFKKLHNKFSTHEHDEEDAPSPTRKDSASSIGSSVASAGSFEEPKESHISRSLSFKDSFLRNRKNSVSSQHRASFSASRGQDQNSERPQDRSGDPSSTQASRRASEDPQSQQDTGAAQAQPPKHMSLKDLEDHKITTRGVGFALSTFSDNPPQRIPPANPEMGNIEFSDSGDMKIFKRSKQRSHKEQPTRVIRNHPELVRSASLKAASSAERLVHSGMGSSFSFFQKNGNNNNSSSSIGSPNDQAEEDDDVAQNLAHMDVDGTKSATHINYSEHHPDSGKHDDGFSEEEWEIQNPNDSHIPPPDQVYIRCCHLREIMPIRNMLKQLQGQVAPIPRLRIANTKPTLVEIQALSDFLAVVPVAALNIDNNILTDEMIKLLFTGISRSTDLCRLSFINTKLNPLGWQYLCSYLGYNAKGVLALSLGCTNPTGVPNKVSPFNRSIMDWDLFIEALGKYGSLEELDLGGTMIPTEKIKPLLFNGFQESGQILSLAYNELNHAEVKLVGDWAQLPETHLMGINLSGNNLSRQEDRYVLQQLLTNTKLMQLSLRNANFTAIDASHISKVITPEQASMSNLRQLDLSCNPGLFPDLAHRLFNLLPKFPNLTRLQFENCNLSSDMVISLCESLSLCHRLVFLNLQRNQPLTQTSITALCVAVHLSRSICTVEADIDDANTALRQQLARYCFQNLEVNTGVLASSEISNDQDENADITSFYDDLATVRKSLTTDGPESVQGTPELITRVDDLRVQINKRLQSIFVRRKVAPPTTQDRMNAIRLLFYASSLDKLKKEITGADKETSAPVPGEEMVKNVDEADIIPVLKRQASQASIISLKKLEREEGESHKAYAENLLDLDDDKMLDALGNLKVQDLEKIMK